MTRALVRIDASSGLGPGLTAAQAALASAPNGAAIEWRLPPGDHVISSPLTLGAPHVDLLVRGVGVDESSPNGRTLIQMTGGVTLSGLRVELSRMGILGSVKAALSLSGTESARASSLYLGRFTLAARGASIVLEDVHQDDADGDAGLDLFGDVVELRGAVVRMTGTSAGTRTGALLTGRTSLSASDVEVSNVRGGGARGLEACSPRVSLARINVYQVKETSAVPAGGDGVVGATGALGIVAEATRSLSATGLRVTNLEADKAVGIRLVCAGAERLSVTDAWFDGAAGVAFAAGVLVAATGPVSARGITSRHVNAHRSAGLWLAAHGGQAGPEPGRADESELDVSVIHVEEVWGSQGVAAGARFFATAPRARTRVRDAFVDGVGRSLAGAGSPGAPPPAPNGVSPSSLRAWSLASLDALAAARAPAEAMFDDPDPSVRVRAGALDLPGLPQDADIVGLHIEATAEEIDPLGTTDFGAVALEDSMIRRAAGTGARVDASMRSASLRRTELWQTVRAARVEAEGSLLAEITAHAHDGGFVVGPGEARVFNTIVSGITAGPAIKRESEGILVDVQRVLTTASDATEDLRVRPLGALPYVTPGPSASAWLTQGYVPQAQPVDLRLLPGSAAAKLTPAKIPADPEGRTFLGAHEPEVPPRCDARDPEPRAWAAAAPRTAPDPAVSYLARDADDFLAMMLDRAKTTMSSWTDRGAADMTTMLFELFADQLDHAAYKQERAVEEGYLSTARLRRSVEDHARALDAEPDPGLSATAMIRFRIDVGAIPSEPPELKDNLLSDKGAAWIPSETLVANKAEDEAARVFATEEPLLCVPSLDELSLHRDCPEGATSAQLAWVEGMERIVVGRWLVLLGGEDEAHVVRITRLERGADALLVQWDPRRRLPFSLTKEAARVLGNVVPAHHGLPLLSLGDASPDEDRLLGRYRRTLTIDHDGALREVSLPFSPVSVQARGYPLPGDETRRGEAKVRVAVEGDPWRIVSDLSLHGPSDEVCTLRSGTAGGQVLLFGGGVNGSALPSRVVRLDLDMTVGMGRAGNVAAGRLVWLLRLGPHKPGDTSIEEGLPNAPEADREDLLRRVLRVDNPLPAVGGRDPEDLDVLRERAPRTVMDAQSAVTPEDFERLTLALPEVRAARARLSEDRVRPVIRMTVLLRDEDTLDVDEAQRDERLRRWALVRRRLEEVRLLGVDVEVAPPRWAPLDLDITIDAAPHAEAGALRDAVFEALAGDGGLFDPDRSGLGGDVHLSSVYQAVLAVPGVAAARVLRFRRLAPFALDRLGEGVIPIGADEVPVIEAPRAGADNGLLTLTVCGGLR